MSRPTKPSAEIEGMGYDELVHWLRCHRSRDPLLQSLAEKAAPTSRCNGRRLASPMSDSAFELGGSEGRMSKAERDDGMTTRVRLLEAGSGVRGKYVESFREDTNPSLLEPDIGAAFPTDDHVSSGLRSCMKSLARGDTQEGPPNETD